MKLTTRQKNTLAKHQKAHGHTKAHMEYMKRKMREGVSFTEAHNMAMKRKQKSPKKLSPLLKRKLKSDEKTKASSKGQKDRYSQKILVWF